MKLYLKSAFLLPLLMGACMSTYADSPLTSTNIAEFYTEHDIVEYALEKQVLDQRVLDYLLNDKQPLDVKAAVINALSWTSAIDRYPDLLNGLTKKYGTGDVTQFSPGDLACLAYLSAMDDYFDVLEEAQWITLAMEKQPESTTIRMLYAMIMGQLAMDFDWCAVWEYTRLALQGLPEVRDMKTAAIQNIVDYTILYKSSCDVE
ncbi:MAG: hypothetical protein ABR95_13580 [Sphingobacteriales bacterium BACL12 MAG-120813-bin55]|jgi:hypothetical protein|nr:MAG: hypothetical protein ABR95_13580 [Sphingobacteriales bacterium BACL12 MAG-120813-bin55]